MPRLMRRAARAAVVVGTATAVSNRVSKGQQAPPPQEQQPVTPAPEATVEATQSSAPSTAPAEAAEPAEEDMSAKLEQLQQLGELKAQGILSEAEFEEQKQRILSS
jgi:Short C-terminal domain